MKKKDIILIVSICIIALLSYVLILNNKKPGAEVIIRVDGVEVARYNLDIDGTYELNGGTNILVIKDKEAYLIDANCPDKLCINQGKISKNGETITCLPNKLTVTVVGNKNDVEIIS